MPNVGLNFLNIDDMQRVGIGLDYSAEMLIFFCLLILAFEKGKFTIDLLPTKVVKV